MKYRKNCGECGHTITAYTHNLNESLVRALRRLVDTYEIRKKPIALGDLNLTTSQYTNFAHLQYFGLVQNTTTGWVPTELGIDFIHGDRQVTTPAGVMNDEVLPADHEAWKTHKGDRREVFVQDIDTFSYKQRSEYMAEKSTANSLF